MLGLIFPNLSVPFESNDQYKEYCESDLAVDSSKHVLGLKEKNAYDKLYSNELIEMV